MYNCPIVPAAMSKNRFKEIKRNLHCADNDRLDSTDRMYKLRPLMDLLNKNLQQFGIFTSNLSIDEEMVPYYGPHPLKMYMRAKPVRFGYKLWVLASSDGYPFSFYVYMGKVSTEAFFLLVRIILYGKL